jgi:hypothetical protein
MRWCLGALHPALYVMVPARCLACSEHPRCLLVFESRVVAPGKDKREEELLSC